MAKGGNGTGGGKPGGGGSDGGGSGVQWRGSRGNDYLYIVDDADADSADEIGLTDFLAGFFDARRGDDTLDFSGLTSDGIYVRLSGNGSEFSGDQEYLGFLFDYRTAPPSSFVTGSIVGFENVVGTDGNDSISGFPGAIAIIDGGAGDDLIDISAHYGSVLIGGEGADHITANGAISVGGTWNGSYGTQAGDGETDLFVGYATILDFELPDGSFEGDRLVISGLIGSGNAGAIEAIQALEFEDRLWIGPDGVWYDSAVLPTLDGTGALFVLVGVSAEDANALVLPEIGFRIGTVEAGFLLTGTANDDWFELPDAGNQVLFEIDGGNDTLLYSDDDDPADDTLFFEGSAPEDWTYAIVNGVDTWTADYNGQTITIVGLDAAGFGSLTMESVPIA